MSVHVDTLTAKPDGARDLSWSTLYRVGAIAALAVAALTVIQIVLYGIWPPPSFDPTPLAVSQWFGLLRQNVAFGLVELDALMILDYALMVPAYLALYVALRDANRSLMAIGAATAAVAIALCLMSSPSLSLLALSNQYAAATTDVERAGYLAAGQAVLALYHGTPFIVHYVLMGIAGLIVSWVMLQSAVFSRPTAYAGLLQGALMLVPSTVGTIGIVLSLASLVPFVVWFILVARRLFRLAPGAGREPRL